MEREQKLRKSNVDRISELPDPLIHKILSLLSPEEAISTSILSKSWRYKWISLPVFDLGKSLFHQFMIRKLASTQIHPTQKPKLQEELKKSFLHFVDRTLRRRSEHQFSIQCLHLYVPKCRMTKKISAFLDQFIDHSMNNFHLEELTFYNDSAQTRRRYKFSGNAFAPYLTLKRLSLGKVLVNQELMSCLATNCPLLERLFLDRCVRLEALTISGLSRLHEVILHVDRYAAIVVIDAPNLRSLDYKWESTNWRDYNMQPRFPIKVITEVHLTYLRVRQAVFIWSPEVAALLCNVEELVLEFCIFNGVNFPITSTCLKSLCFRGLTPMNGLITAPNLTSIKSDGLAVPSFSSKCWPVETVSLHLHYFCRQTDVINFVMKLKSCETLELFTHSVEQDLLMPTQILKASSDRLYDVKHLMMSISYKFCYWKSNRIREFLKFMLWISRRPQTISVSLVKQNSNVDEVKILKFKYFEQGENAAKRCSRCKHLPVLCWKHNLQEVTVENHKGVDGIDKNYKRRSKTRANDDANIQAFFEKARRREKIIVNRIC